MVPIKPVEMMTELLLEEIKEATWAERWDAIKFLLWTVPTDILVELFYWAKEKRVGPDLPEHWLDAERGIVHTPPVTPSELGSNSPYKH